MEVMTSSKFCIKRYALRSQIVEDVRYRPQYPIGKLERTRHSNVEDNGLFS